MSRTLFFHAKKTKAFYLSFLFLFLTISNGFGQNLKWVNTLKSDQNTIVRDIQISPDNNGYYVCGYFSNTVNFNPKGTAIERTATVGTDAYVAKYDNDGLLVWLDTLYAAGGDGFNKIALSADGSRLYAGGYTNYGAQFMGYSLVRIDPTTGQKIWKRNLTGGNYYANEVQDLVADESSDEGVYVAGYTRNGITIDFDPVTPGQQGHTNGGKYVSVTKFDKDAIYISQFVGMYFTDAVAVQTSLIMGNDGNLFLNMGGTWPANIPADIAAYTNFNIVKLSPALSLLASTRSSQQPPVTANYDFIFLGSKGVLKLAKDQLTNDIYAYGNFNGTVDLNSNPNLVNNITSSGDGTTTDIFVAKYDATTLAYVSSWKVGGTGNELASNLIIDENNIAKFAGYFNTGNAFGQSTLINNGGEDGFIADFNLTTGAYISGKRFGGTGNEVVFSSAFSSSTSTFMLGGYYGSTSNFDFIGNEGVQTHQNAVDGFLAKYKTCILPNTIVGPSTVCRGTDFTLTASATGDNLSYQWYKDGVALVDGNGFTGTNTDVLTVNYTGASWGRYKCLISNSCDEAFTADYIFDLNDGLILHHDYTNGSLADVSGNSPNGTMNASGFGTDRFGNTTAAFNPTFGQIVTVSNIPDLPVGNSAYTYSVWVNNSSSNPPAFGIMGYGPNNTRQGNQLVRGSDAGKIDNDWINDPLVISTGFIGVGSWLQIVCSYDPETRIQKANQSYNPSFNYQRTITNLPNFVASDFRIGVSALGWNFQGLIDEPRVYKRAISALETNVLMNLPNISLQPQNKVACLGQEANLKVKGQSLNGTVSYQWYKNGIALVDGATIQGATTDSLVILNTSVSDEGTYFVEVYDNCHLILSKKVTLSTQSNDISISAQPIVSQAVCEGTSATMTVETSGATPTSYKWFKDGSEVANSNSSTLTISSVDPSLAGIYTVEIYGASCGTLISNQSTLTVKPATSITTQPASEAVCLGGDVTLNVVATGEGTLSYEWREDGSILAETSSTLSLQNITLAHDYEVTVTGECGSVVSSLASVTLSPATVITTQPTSQVSCSGPTVSLSVQATGDNLTYQWKKGGVDLTGETFSFLSFFSISNNDAGDYSVEVNGTCGSIASNTATITVNPATSIISQPSSANACIGGSQSFEVQAQGTGTLTYQWRKDGNDISGETASTLNLSNLNASDNGDYTVLVIGDCGSILSSIATLSISQISNTLTESACVSYVFDGNTLTQSGTYTASFTTAQGCDSLVTLNLTILNPTTSSLSETACDSYTLNGQTYTESGVYTQVLTNTIGCDSTITLYLTINHPATSTLTETACLSYTLNGETYTSSGTYIQNLNTVGGCDSTLTLNLTISNFSTSTLNETACDPYTLNGETYTSSGTYTQTTTSVFGCDSIITLNLTINEATSSELEIIACDTYTLNGQTYTESGVYTQDLTNVGGCDSTLTLMLTIHPSVTSSITESACGSFTLNGETYTTSGVYNQVLQSTVGCDSTVTLNLTINQATSSTITETACGSFVLNGETYTSSGTYTQTLQNAAGCDSTLTLELTINPISTHTISATACDSYELNGEIYTTSGTYTQTLTNSVACDSILTLELVINNSQQTTETVSVCVSYEWNGQTYTSSGTYTESFTTLAGCDSIATLELTINTPSTSLLTETVCGSYILNGETYTETGIYTQVITNAAGCDSTITLDVTILPQGNSTLIETACESYTLNGETYTESGVYTQAIQTVGGCDSIVTLNLTILSPESSTLTETSCSPFTLNDETYTETGVYTQVLQTTSGCDSIVTLNLTVININNTVNQDNEVLTANQAGATYQWVDCNNASEPIPGATDATFTATENGSYAVLINLNGCESMSACMEVTTLSTDAISGENSVQVYPNPASSQLTVAGAKIGTKVRISDLSGKVIFDGKVQSDIEMLSIDAFASGVYNLTLSYENKTQQVIKLVIAK